MLSRSVFEGTPLFNEKRFKDDFQLITELSCETRPEGYSPSLELHPVGPLQSGIYSRHVSDEAGVVRTSAELVVKGWTSVFCPPPSQLTIIHLFSSVSKLLFLHFTLPRSHLSPSSIRPIDSHLFICAEVSNLIFFYFAEPPQFVLKLPPKTFVKQSEGHRFQCKATCSRSLNMCWYKNDEKITDGGNYETMFVDSAAYLQLRTTRSEDNGVYTCEAHNDAGSASCSSVLTVQG